MGSHQWKQVEYWVIGQIPNNNYTAFSCNNISMFCFEISADRSVLNLKSENTQGAIFPIDILLLVLR